jgi:hypothetical protein
MTLSESRQAIMCVDEDVIDSLAAALARFRCGPRVDTSMMGQPLGPVAAQLEQRAERVVRRVMTYVPEKKRRHPHIFFCEDEQYGAFALRDNYDYIVLKFGLVLRLTHFCERMMSSPGLWPDVRDDVARNAVAVIFMSECFDLVVRHELAHLVLGHVDPEGIAVRADPIVAQTLELVADDHAASWGVENLLRVPEMVGRLPAGIDRGYREFHSTPEDAMLNYLLAIYFVFRIMDEAPWESDTLARRSHSPASMRFHATCIHLNETLKRLGNIEMQGHFLQARQKVWKRGESIFTGVLDREPDFGLEDRTMSGECEKLYERMSAQARVLPPHFFGLT